jgi:pyrroline-5-carboxylate reductase
MRKLSRLAVVGVGNMGEALVKGLLHQGLVDARDLIGVETLRSRAEEVARSYGITVQATAAEACQGAEAVILAVKPQDVDVAVDEIATGVRGSLVLSVCAGITLAHLASRLPQGTPIARVMPNTPALVGCGASVYCPNEHVSEALLATTEAVLGAVGTVYRVEKEELLDAVTGLSGSGPGYAFAFLEALADGGVLMGLSRPLAQALACQTLLGAAKLVEQTGAHPAELKDRVSSPAGTTIAGLRELELRGFRGAVIEAIRSATLRSRELGG